MRVAALLAIALLFGAGAGALIVLGTRDAALVTGGVLLLVGIPLMALARRQLGSAFAFAPQAKRLVTTGLYSRVPHSMYFFLDLALLGGIMMLRRVWLLVPWLGLVAAQTLQARRESRILEGAFGDSYREYRKRTWW